MYTSITTGALLLALFAGNTALANDNAELARGK